MHKSFQDRIHRLAAFDLIFSELAFFLHVVLTSVFYSSIIGTKFTDKLEKLGGEVLAVFMAISIPLRLVLIYSAFRLHQVVEKIDTDPGTVLRRFRSWYYINVTMSPLYVLLLILVLAGTNFVPFAIFMVSCVIYNWAILTGTGELTEELQADADKTKNAQVIPA